MDLYNSKCTVKIKGKLIFSQFADDLKHTYFVEIGVTWMNLKSSIEWRDELEMFPISDAHTLNYLSLQLSIPLVSFCKGNFFSGALNPIPFPYYVFFLNQSLLLFFIYNAASPGSFFAVSTYQISHSIKIASSILCFIISLLLLIVLRKYLLITSLFASTPFPQ